MSCLFISEINSLSVALFAIIFSHSEGCLFTLLIVSSVVQKLLSLIRSHLFTFVFISVTIETVKLLEENISRILDVINQSKNLYNPPSIVTEIKTKVNK